MQTKQLLLLLVAMLAALATTVGQTTISGVVTDAGSKEPLIGANIVFAGTSEGTSTEIDGSYSLQVPRGALAIEISYTGYKTVIVVLDGKSVINVALESGQLLDEVIVIGYGTVAKRDVTGAIASLRPKEGQVLQYDNFQQYLQGRITGVYIQSNGSELLAPNTVRIRGSNSLRGDNEPLYVVDGIVITSATEDVADPLSSGNSYLAPQSGLTGINPQDIESIEVLKDASATAIYGSRGANGVILITTKKGKEGKAKFSYKATSRIGTPTRLVDVLDTDQYVDYQDEFRKSRGFAPNFYRYADGSIAQFAVDTAFMEARADSLPKLKPVNWYEDIFQNSFSQNHRLSINGGKANSGYYVALGYSDAKGYVPGVRATQGDFVFNFNQEISPKLTISPRISGAYLNNRASKGTENLGSTNTSLIRQIVLAAPFLGFTENNVDLDASDAIDGPRAWLEDYNDDSEEYRLLASVKADYQLSKAFTWRFLAGADYRAKTRQVWFGKSTFRGNQANGEAGISQLDRFRYNVDNTLMYKKKIKRHHTINATAGIVFDATNVKLSSFAASDFANEELRYHGISFGQAFQPLQYDQTQEAIMSFLGRVHYTFKDKYLVTASFRSDGASKFAPGNRYSFFPSAALAWKLSEEAFFKKARFSEAKLRIGYGRTGSQAIRPYQTFSRFGATANLLSDGVGGGVSAIVPLNLSNPNLIWETTDQFNAGFDFGWKNDRLTGNLDVYYKQTHDLLQELAIGPSAGFSNIITNQGDLVNKGIELGLTAHILEGPLKWTLSGNISVNRNQIKNLGLPPAQFGTETYSAFLGRFVSGGTVFKVPANIFIEGKPAGLFWGYQTNGIITDASVLQNAPRVQGVAPQLGDILYVDRNSDGNINDQDLTIIGNPNPDFIFGINSELSFKRFRLDLFINGVQGNDIANGNLGREDFALGNSDNLRSAAYFGAWREGKTDATHPRLGYPIQGDFTDRMVEDGSFVRLTYVSLSYELPPNTIKGISSAGVFVSGHNLLLLTTYSGFDPEVNSFSFDPSRQGIDWVSFPNQRAISFGLNLNF